MKFDTKFNYLGHKDIIGNFYGTQKDWNQLLITKINLCLSNNILENNVIKCPLKFKKIIESLEHYWDNKINLSDCTVNVIFIDNNENFIDVNNKTILIENYEI